MKFSDYPPDKEEKLLAKFKPDLLTRLIWWLNRTMRTTSEADLKFNRDKIYNNNPTETDFTKAYYATRELDRRARKQEKFIENLKRK